MDTPIKDGIEASCQKQLESLVATGKISAEERGAIAESLRQELALPEITCRKLAAMVTLAALRLGLEAGPKDPRRLTNAQVVLSLRGLGYSSKAIGTRSTRANLMEIVKTDFYILRRQTDGEVVAYCQSTVPQLQFVGV